MSSPLISINMVSYNTREITLQALYGIHKSLQSAWFTTEIKQDVELILVDNASHDGTVEAVQSHLSEFCFSIHIISLRENIGFGRGHNIAASHSKGEYLLLLNTDTVPVTTAIHSLCKSYFTYDRPHSRAISLTYDTTGLKRHFMGPRLLNADFSPQASCGSYYTLPTTFCMLFLGGDRLQLTRSSPQITTKTDWVSGACFITRKSYFDELGGFDTEIFMYMEEVELMHRAQKKGMTIWYEPYAEVVHLGSASSNKTYPVIQMFRGLIYLYKKHHSKLQLRLVQYLLTFKALLGIVIGRLIRSTYLVHTYTQSLKVIYE